MSVVDRERFILGLSKSGALRGDKLAQWKSEASSDADSKSLAKDLISKGAITTWQAKMILKGVAKLTIGNYLLTERVEKTKLGDFFAAVHPQLSRAVSIQYLAAELSQSADSRKKIFALGSKLAELDHSNLLHVYDVDEEGDRIYLVSELGNAVPLPEYFLQNPTLSCPEIAKLTLGCLEGVQYAHDRGIVHGGISSASIFVKKNGEAKIGELTRFAVSNAIAENPAGPESDFAAIRKVAGSLLRRVPQEAQDTEQFTTLKTSITSLLSDRDSAMVGLRELADLHVVSSDVLDSDIALLVETELVSADDSPTVDFASQQTAAVQTQPLQPRRTLKQPAAEQVPEKGASLFEVAKRYPALISLSVLALLVLLGGSIFAATSIMSSPTVAVADAGGKDLTSNVSLLSDKPAGRANRKEAVDPEANRKAIEAMFGSEGDNSSSDSALETETSARKEKPNARPKPDKAPAKPAVALEPKASRDAIEEIFSEKKADKEPGEAMRPVEVAVTEAPQPVVSETPMSPAETTAASKPVAKQPAKQQELQKGQNPFTRFASAVDLPGIDSTDQASFGKLILEKRHLLGAEILSSPNAHRSKPIFVMSRSSDDRQSWDIGYTPKKKKEPTTIAKLQKTANEQTT